MKATSAARSKVKNSCQLKWSCEVAHELNASLVPNSDVCLSRFNVFKVGYFRGPTGCNTLFPLLVYQVTDLYSLYLEMFHF